LLAERIFQEKPNATLVVLYSPDDMASLRMLMSLQKSYFQMNLGKAMLQDQSEKANMQL
jgi:hypothetical protein